MESLLRAHPLRTAFGVLMAAGLLWLTWLGGWNGGERPPTGATGHVGGQPAGALFAASKCAACHTLFDAGTHSGGGPTVALDQARPTYLEAVDIITNGSRIMPAFRDLYPPRKIRCLAAYVASITSGGSDMQAAGGAPEAPADACAGVEVD